MAGRRQDGRADRPGRVGRVVARIEDTREHLEARRSVSSRVDAAFRWIQLQNEAGGPLLAGALAFRIFLFLLPLVFAAITGLGIGADLSHADARQVARSFGMAGLAATAVQASDSASTATRWWTFALAVFALVLASRNLLRALLVTHALIWRLPGRKARHLTRAAFAVIGLFAVALAVLRLVSAMQSASALLLVAGLVLFVVVPAVVWLLCSITVFPHPPSLTWRAALPGALLFGVGVEALHLATVVWFAPYLESKSATYGAIGAAIAILLWAYLLGRLITASVALNAVLSDDVSRPGGEPDS
jgi:uncharacterized BrkB/YihY/UPF0761 family membrane protein